jgi:hypothetical protein
MVRFKQWGGVRGREIGRGRDRGRGRGGRLGLQVRLPGLGYMTCHLLAGNLCA